MIAFLKDAFGASLNLFGLENLIRNKSWVACIRFTFQLVSSDEFVDNSGSCGLLLGLF